MPWKPGMAGGQDEPWLGRAAAGTSVPPVDGLADQRVGIRDAVQALGVAEEQHVSRALQLRHAREQLALRVLVEIDDDVAAEDRVERPLHGERMHEVELA